ncbi:unnamed protein product [Gongylonema pulchrum]|uniref:Myosin_tail_1 domain-containing protein n=1 Tax=Gongylonema pulchrum TaxID=637853 RepID=A0A183E1B8_9BILA|nr:unnamed protein product [Gongylonema pulchrum]
MKEERLQALASIRQQYSELSGQHGQYSRRLQAIHESLKHSAAQILRNEIADIEAELPQYRETVENGAMERKKLEEKITLLSERKKNEKMFRVEFMLSFLFLLTDQYRFKIQFQEKEKKEAQKELAAAEKELASVKSIFEKAKVALETLREEIASLQKAIGEDEADLSNFQKETEKGAEQMVVLEEKVAQAKVTRD